MKKGQRDLLILGALVIGVALGAKFFLRGKGEDPRHNVPDDVQVCKQHLRRLHRALVDYSQREGSLPDASGSSLLATLFTSGVLEDTPENRDLLACPGPGAVPLAMDADWSDASSFGPAHSGYAVRDLVAHSIRQYPTGGKLPFLACDQSSGSNHEGLLNVLDADGSVRTFVLEQLLAEGTLPPGTLQIELGPDSALEELRVFPSEN